MVRVIAACLFSLTLFVSAHAFALFALPSLLDRTAEKPPDKKVSHFKLKQISVPVLSANSVKGYLLVQLGYSRESDADKSVEAHVESVLLDEALSFLFPKAQESGVDKLDMDDVRKNLLARVQARIPDRNVTEIRFHEFTFMPRADAK